MESISKIYFDHVITSALDVSPPKLVMVVTRKIIINIKLCMYFFHFNGTLYIQWYECIYWLV